MALEIYYTSAPQGLRPGDRGFCTVGASEGISRALMDRLEALSGYRHHFVGSAASPVCHAHWVLRLDSRDSHVLSRVCDAGLDYTQRTNSWAHHIVLDAAELADAGPAWMLRQSGVMVERWDGQVGPIIRPAPLPRGDLSPGPCSQWQRLAGDAGWAGLVAQAVATSSWKPVVLLFAADQPVLSLVDEVAAILPPASRWQMTFSTYFTNLPGGMTCQWRCCAASSPAASALRRWAAGSNGLILDISQGPLTEALPQGPWIDAARNGQVVPLVSKAPRPPGTPRFVALPFKTATPDAPTEEPAAEPIELKVSAGGGGIEEITIHRRPMAGATVPQHSQAHSATTAEASWMTQRRKARQRRLMIIYVLACAIFAGGAWLAYLAQRSSSDVPLPPLTPATRVMDIVPEPEPILPPPPPAASVPVVAPPSTTQAVVVAPPVTLPATMVAPVPLPPPPPPSPIALAEPLAVPAPGNGMRDIVTTAVLPAAKLENPAAVAIFSLTFPDGSKQFRFHQGDLDGLLAVRPQASEHRPSFEVTWRDPSDLAGPVRVLTIAFDRTVPQLELKWNSALMLRRPHVADLAYWVIQNSTLLLADKNQERTQPVTFAPRRLKPIRLAEPNPAAALPENLPAPLRVTFLSSLPAGWQEAQAATTEPRKAGPAKDFAGEQVLRLEKQPFHGGMVPAVTLHYSYGQRTMVSDLARVTEAAKADLAAAVTEVKNGIDEIQQLRDAFLPRTAALEERINEWTARKQQAATAPTPGDQSVEQYEADLKVMRQKLEEHKANRDAAVNARMASQKDSEARCVVLREALAEYAQLKELELALDMPQGLRVGTVRMVREPE